MSLDVEVVRGSDAGAGVGVLLHGRGADRADMRSLVRELPRDWTWVLPNAPFEAAPWGYGPGYAWYRFLGSDQPDAASFAASLAALDDLIAALPAELGTAPQRLVLGGFSQGGTVGLGYAFARPGRVQAVLNFSGFLPVHEEVVVNGQGAGRVRVFWGHGTHDPSIPFALAVAGRQRLADAGVPLEAHDYDIGHWIDPAELADAAAFLATLHDPSGGAARAG